MCDVCSRVLRFLYGFRGGYGGEYVFESVIDDGECPDDDDGIDYE